MLSTNNKLYEEIWFSCRIPPFGLKVSSETLFNIIGKLVILIYRIIILFFYLKSQEFFIPLCNMSSPNLI